MQHTRSVAFVLTVLASIAVGPAQACDICAIYTSTEMQEARTGLRLSVAEQFTRSTSLQRDGEEVENPDSERLESSITQVVAGYAPHPRLLLQVNVPVIHRGFRRLEARGVASGAESGIGDLSLHALMTAWSHVSANSLQRISLLAGVKVPTGSPSRLREEIEENHSHSDQAAIPDPFRSRLHPRHSGEAVESGIHGHDLALGTGSTDVILGLHGLVTYKRWYWNGFTQYFVRTEGSFDYTFANELVVSGGPGYFVLLDHRQSLGLQSLLTLDTKGTDSQAGRRLPDTGVTFLYAGPAAHWTWGTQLSVDAALDIPVIRNNTDLQIVPDFRLRGGLTWRF